jgi:hypothetical protein
VSSAVVRAVLQALGKKAGPEATSAPRASASTTPFSSLGGGFQFCVMLGGMSTLTGSDPKAQLRAGVYARLSETYDAVESVPTQLANGERHAERRGWVVAGRFKDDGYSAYKEIARDDFVRLVAAIEAGDLDVVVVRDVDRLTRNLTDWNRFEKARVRHGVLLSLYAGGDLDLVHPRRRVLRRDGDAASQARERCQERPCPRGQGARGAGGEAGRGRQPVVRVRAGVREPG